MPVDQSLQVTAIPAFDDNYLWLIHDQEYAAIVDPGDAASVEAALAAHHLKLAAILLTHHHADHAGGVPALLRHWNVPVYGPASERIPGISHPLREGDVVTLTSPALQLSVLDVPGHTAGHIAYVAAGKPWLFCGDTLYAESEVLDKRESASRPQQGVVTVSTKGINQHGDIVCTFERTILVWKRGHGPSDD
jgi:hydroxyacylglutathione hydrolase